MQCEKSHIWVNGQGVNHKLRTSHKNFMFDSNITIQITDSDFRA